MTLLIISFLSGVLTVLAPCILPLLPVVIGASASGRSPKTPYIVVGSLALSIILFTFLLKVSTLFIMIPPELWAYLSGGIIMLFGLMLFSPGYWERIPGIALLSRNSNELVGAGYKKKTLWGDVMIGAALGPVFSTCSPTYFVILASVLPASFGLGTLYLFAYTFGLSLVLLLAGLLGDRFTQQLSQLADAHGKFKRGIGVFFILLGVAIISGYEKQLETKILESGYFDVTKIEQLLLQQIGSEPVVAFVKTPYTEIVDPSGFVNTEPLTIRELIGKKVVLVDFLTYSCINCQRTFPYLNAWYEKYKDQGLEIVGIHTPEFAFEKDIDNVRAAMKRFGITHPIVLDNDYGTWNAYENRYWPNKYLIDIHGNVVYQHIGEGAYEETETKIKELLAERAALFGDVTKNDDRLVSSAIEGMINEGRSPETYFGSHRNEFLANGDALRAGAQTFSLPNTIKQNKLYLVGVWNITPEYAESSGAASVYYKYNAREVFIVGDASIPTEMEVFQDGARVGISAGEDVDEAGTVVIKESRLYKLIRNNVPGEHTLELRIKENGVRLYALTFG